MREPPPLPDGRIALRVWWAYTWRFAVWFIIPSMGIPFVMFAANAPAPVRKIMSFLLVCYMIWLQIHLFRKILAMDFGTFRVRVESKN